MKPYQGVIEALFVWYQATASINRTSYHNVNPFILCIKQKLDYITIRPHLQDLKRHTACCRHIIELRLATISYAKGERNTSLPIFLATYQRMYVDIMKHVSTYCTKKTFFVQDMLSRQTCSYIGFISKQIHCWYTYNLVTFSPKLIYNTSFSYFAQISTLFCNNNL